MNVTENQIEAFIRYPESLSEKNKREIRKQIDSDPEAGDYYRWFKSFYSAFEELSLKKISGEKTESTITLIPLEKDAGAERSMFVLAAQSSETDGAVIETVRTFASEERRMLLRALHYRNKNEIRIHVLSEQIENDDIVLFDVPEKNLFLVTSPGGKLSAKVTDIQPEDVKNWKLCKVHLPVCKANGFGNNSSNSGYLAGKSAFSDEIIPIEMEVGKDTVELCPIMDKRSSLCHHLVLYKNSQPSIIEMNDGMAVLPIEVLENDEIRLYFYN